MRKVWFIAIMAVCVAMGTGCGRFQVAGEPGMEDMISVAEKSGAGEDISREDYGSQEPEYREDATSNEVQTEDIFWEASVYETDNGFAVYRTNDREMDCDYEGDYLAIQDMESGDIIYLPDSYGRILDVKVGFHRIVGYREIFYQDGQVQEERYLEKNDLEGSVWFADEYTVKLHTFGSEWTRVSETIGGMTIDKEVRERGGNGT